MFDHLDDDLGFTPDDTFRSATLRRGRSLRRRRRAATGISVGGCSLLLAIGGIVRWTDDQLDEVDRLDVAEGVLAPPATAPGEPTNFLIVGVDEPSLPSEPAGATNGVARTDTIMVVRAAPDGRLSVLSVPRDLWVSDDGGEDRINTAIQQGPDHLIQVVSDALGIPIHHYVQVDFEGFRVLVDQVGGVPLDFPAPMKDDTTGFSVDAPGCRVLDGTQALAYARSRRALEAWSPDGWHLDPTSDLGRMARQRVLASAAAHALVDLEPTPGDLQALVDVFTDHAVVDDALTNDDLLSWGRWLVSRGDDNLSEYALPVEEGMVGNASVLFLLDGWEQVVAEFEAGQPQSEPATVSGPGGPEVPAPLVPTLCS